MSEKLTSPIIPGRPDRVLPVAWFRFIDHCTAIGNGEIDKLKIQGGVPMIAETVTKKVKFA